VPKQKEIEHIKYAIPPERHTPMYYMHKYWARKPHNVVSKYIETYSNESEVILDPFSGSGVTAIEALKLHRKAIALDLDPMSNFITRMTGTTTDISQFQKDFEFIEKETKSKIMTLYETKCARCNEIGILSHVVWKIDENGESEKPVEEWYYCKCKRGIQKKSLDENDEIKLQRISKTKIPYWVPENELIWNTRVNVHKGTRVVDLFTHRNLIALSVLLNSIEQLPNPETKDLMKFVFTGFVIKASRMNFVNVGGYKSLGRGWCVRGYWVPKEHMEQNVWHDFEAQYRSVLKGKTESNSTVDFRRASDYDRLKRTDDNILIVNGSAIDIPIPANSVDYVFTDPPYGDSIPYLELHYLWSSWLKMSPNFGDEIIISDSPVRKDKNFDMYYKMLSKAFREVYRVLKPERWLTVTFHILI
jgi:16S rRNA G966 N2-methylase RsmD